MESIIERVINTINPKAKEEKTVEIKELELKANELRQEVIRMLTEAGSGHTGGSLGMADIFTALYFKILNHKPDNPSWAERDYLVLSNGHVCPVMYAAMAHSGYFPVDELMTLRKLGSKLQGHPHREALPGLETSSGPLGSGLSQACGMALALKMDKKKNHVYCILSDGEQDEGNTWESVMFAAKNKITNMTVIMDRNHIQLSGKTKKIMPLESLKEKYEAFGWKVVEIDGNNISEVIEALERSKKLRMKPLIIIANTIMGKGVDFMENNYKWHGKAPKRAEAADAMKQLQKWQRKIKRQ